jgi:hypothetical protein
MDRPIHSVDKIRVLVAACREALAFLEKMPPSAERALARAALKTAIKQTETQRE